MTNDHGMGAEWRKRHDALRAKLERRQAFYDQLGTGVRELDNHIGASMTDLIEKVARAILRQQLDEIDMGISEELREAHVNERWRDREPEAKAAAAVVVKDQLEWVSDKAHENCEQGSDLWDWKALLDAAIRAYANENGIDLNDK